MKVLHWRMRDALCVLAVLTLAVLVWAPRFRGPIDLRYDAGVYYILGKALAEGSGYRLLNEPGEILAIQYPPALPAFVASHQWAMGSTDPEVVGRALRGSFFVLFLCYGACVYAMARLYLPDWGSMLVAAITILLTNSVFLSDLLFSEIPFALVAVAFLLCNRRDEGRIFSVPTALLGAVAYLLRSAGIALLAAWVLEGLLNRRWRQAAARAAFSLVLVAGWQGYTGWVQSREDYRNPPYEYQRASYQYYNVTYAENLRLVDPFMPELGPLTAQEMVLRVVGHVPRTLASLGHVVTGADMLPRMLSAVISEGGIAPAWHPWIVVGVPAGFGLLGVCGAVILLRRRDWLIPIYVAGSLAMIGLTPWISQYGRYVTPLVPFYAMLLVQALWSFAELTRRRWPSPWQRTGAVVLVLVVGLTLAREAASLVRFFRTHHLPVPLVTEEGTRQRLFYFDATWADFEHALQWLREHAEPDAVVVTASPHQAYLETGLKAVMPPMEADPDRARELLDSVPASYILIEKFGHLDISTRYALPVIERHPGQWEEVYTSPEGLVAIYRRVDHEGRSGEASDASGSAGASLRR